MILEALLIETVRYCVELPVTANGKVIIDIEIWFRSLELYFSLCRGQRVCHCNIVSSKSCLRYLGRGGKPQFTGKDKNG